jgi:hypothetical protein
VFAGIDKMEHELQLEEEVEHLLKTTSTESQNQSQ